MAQSFSYSLCFSQRVRRQRLVRVVCRGQHQRMAGRDLRAILYLWLYACQDAWLQCNAWLRCWCHRRFWLRWRCDRIRCRCISVQPGDVPCCLQKAGGNSVDRDQPLALAALGFHARHGFCYLRSSSLAELIPLETQILEMWGVLQGTGNGIRARVANCTPSQAHLDKLWRVAQTLGERFSTHTPDGIPSQIESHELWSMPQAFCDGLGACLAEVVPKNVELLQ
mmetsp:Transcript_12260/g.23055  ORF Transcript_12260/g.23055 Transcript_12260/m.23055 type:complete len:224 (+) Transcript_12260:728-1399(+)